MEWFAASHARVDGVWLSVGGGVPAGLDVGGGGVESVVSLVVECHCLECSWGFLDVRAGSDFIIFEEDRAGGVALRV